jgi:hypothetical protein
MTTGTFGGFGGGGAWAAGFSRITFSGVFGSATSPWERWAFRLHLDARGSLVQNKALADAGPGLYQTHIAPRLSNVARLTEVKVASLDDAGRYMQDPSITTGDIVGTGSTAAFKAPQVALAVSLVTARRGPTGKGRFYLPLPTATPDLGSGLISAADRDAAQAGAAAFITALNANAHPGAVTVVSTKGYHSPVTGVRVGRRLDVIRSRAGQVSEVFGTPTAVT